MLNEYSTDLNPNYTEPKIDEQIFENPNTVAKILQIAKDFFDPKPMDSSGQFFIAGEFAAIYSKYGKEQ